ncbi:response regulator [Hymenobacter weizhouensis]|uniref:response regulator n=1 Tax=Hymenobacter sp. YIM 151500-1 TaxID=2987689 RepID=UPI002227AFB2|nr:response regulator [Hymenobacter sp. YIM 151500-1]UYZ64645.1 response regulator [Hymenobacter sp. YIM 151500-1]
MRTLLVDDDYTSIFLTKKLVQDAGYEQKFRAFQSSPEALEYVLTAGEDELPNLILLDLYMPVLSGWDFLAALQPYQNQLRGRCLVYILTSSLAGTVADRAREFSLVGGVIHKPLDALQLGAIQARASSQLEET